MVQAQAPHHYLTLAEFGGRCPYVTTAIMNDALLREVWNKGWFKDIMCVNIEYQNYPLTPFLHRQGEIVYICIATDKF